MTTSYENFLGTLESPNTRKVAKSFHHIGQYEHTTGSLEDISKIILEMNPKSPKAITTICYIFGLYAKYLNNDGLYQVIQTIDKSELWKKAKPTAESKFISYLQFQKTYDKLHNHDELNYFYIQTLFQSIYEGIYCENMSVLKNLRASDIVENTVTLHEDSGYTYQLQISHMLAKNLMALGNVHTWERKNRYSYFKMPIEGLAYDSCFKVEIRKSDTKEPYRFSYHRLIRKIAQEYLGYNLLPQQIYVSGIMYRISLQLEEQGISLKEAFSDNNKSRTVSNIIATELKRCNYNIEVRNFRQLVKGHLEIFSPEPSETLVLYKPSNERIEDESLQDIIEYKQLDCNRTTEKNIIYSGQPKPKQNAIIQNGRTVHPRNRAVAINALKLAAHKCEINSSHVTFIRKTDGLPYTEPHHLIPLAYADNFDVSLDVEENIVSLCSHCHNQLHYGKDVTVLITRLYEQRKELLRQVGINITLTELIQMYS